MGEKAKAVLEKVKEFAKKHVKALIVALAVVVVLVAGILIWVGSRPYEVLFTELNSNEMSSILGYMEELGVTDYKVEDADTILVKESQVNSLKVKLLMEGYPQTGFAYTYTQSSGMLSTESERAQAALLDLQNRLSATVRCFEGVREAVVTIDPGEDLNYILDTSRSVDATAAVFVTLKDYATLSTEQAAAIRRLVAHSVSGLDINSVTIEDAQGNRYSTGDSVSDGEASALKLQLEQEWENKIRTEVMRVLTPFYGDEHVKVAVRCVVDVNQIVEESNEVILPDYALDGSTNGAGIIGSRIYSYVVVRDGETTVGGVVGSETNSEDSNFSEYVEDLDKITEGATNVDISGQIDYNNSTRKKHIVQTAGYLTACTISVSIDADVAGEIDEQAISVHIARAAGIIGKYNEETGIEYLGDKISVKAMPFYHEPVIPLPGAWDWLPDWFEIWMLYAAGAALLLLIIIIIIICVAIRKHKKKKKEKAKKTDEQIAREIDEFLAAAAAAAQQEAEGADVMSLQSEKSIELRQDIRKFADESPEIAAQLLRGWLREGDDNG